MVDIDRFLSDNNVAMAVSTMRINPSAKTTLVRRRFLRSGGIAQIKNVRASSLQVIHR